IHVSELVDRRIAHAQEAVREGDILPLKIIRIERDRHRLGLSLKQARDRGEIMGFRFTPDGEVLFVPPEIREEFRDEIAAVQRAAQESAGAAAAEPVGARASAAEVTEASSEPAAVVLEAQAMLEREEDAPQ